MRVNPALGGRLRAIITKALSVALEERHQSAAALREALEDFVAEVGIDDPPALLERYLQDPAGVGDEIRATVVDRLTALGSRASDEGDVPAALDHFNRVLVLDEGNERVLKLIERVGLDRARRRMLYAGGGLLAFGLVAGTSAYALWPDAGSGTANTSGTGRDAEIATIEAPDAGEPDAALAALEPDALFASNSADARTSREPTAPRPRRPVVVALRSLTQDMTVSIDGGPARDWTSLLGRVELVPGDYVFTLTPGPQSRGVYDRTTRRVVVRPGNNPPVELNLPFRDAHLYLRTRTPGARVIVRAGTQEIGRGVANDRIRVEVPLRNGTYRVQVSAPGFRSVTRRVPLAAGGDTVELELDLEPESEVATGP